jgi:hypothetical protein
MGISSSGGRRWSVAPSVDIGRSDSIHVDMDSALEIRRSRVKVLEGWFMLPVKKKPSSHAGICFKHCIIFRRFPLSF